MYEKPSSFTWVSLRNVPSSPKNTGELCIIVHEQIQKNTHAHLCDLRSEVDMTHSPEKMIASMYASQKELSALAPSEVHPGEVVLYIQSANGKRYRVTMKQGKAGTPKDVPFTFRFPDGEVATITRKDENGYNSEYDVRFAHTKGIVLGLIFTSENPEIKIRKWVLQKLIDTIADMGDTLGNHEWEIKALSTKIQESTKPKKTSQKKKWEKIDISAKITEWKARISQLRSVNIPDIQNKLKSKETEKIRTETEMEKFPKYVSFAYSPYQPSFDLPKTREEGMKYIGEGVQSAYRNIATNDPNKANDFRVHTPASVVLLLNVIERMDFHQYIDATKPQKIVTGTERIKQWKKYVEKEISVPAVITKDKKAINTLMYDQMNRALTVFALNREWAYNFQVSDVWAAGIAQLMPNTYTGLRNKHSNMLWNTPERPLDGSRIHDISFQYQAVHVYDQYTQFPGWIQRNWDTLMTDPDTRLGVYMILACGYNGTMSTVMREAGITKEEPEDMKKLLSPNMILSRFQRLDHKHASERYTYALKFQYLYKQLRQDTVTPQK